MEHSEVKELSALLFICRVQLWKMVYFQGRFYARRQVEGLGSRVGWGLRDLLCPYLLNEDSFRDIIPSFFSELSIFTESDEEWGIMVQTLV